MTRDAYLSCPAWHDVPVGWPDDVRRSVTGDGGGVLCRGCWRRWGSSSVSKGRTSGRAGGHAHEGGCQISPLEIHAELGGRGR